VQEITFTIVFSLLFVFVGTFCMVKWVLPFFEIDNFWARVISIAFLAGLSGPLEKMLRLRLFGHELN